MSTRMAREDRDKTATRGDLWVLEDRLDGRMDRFDDVQRRVILTLAELTGSIHDLKTYMVENMATKTEVRELRSQMDGFAGQLGDFRRQWAYQSDGLMSHERRLDDHDRRLGKIESRSQ